MMHIGHIVDDPANATQKQLAGTGNSLHKVVIDRPLEWLEIKTPQRSRRRIDMRPVSFTRTPSPVVFEKEKQGFASIVKAS
jgi:hypothetical protein